MKLFPQLSSIQSLELLAEIEIMKKCAHDNLITYYGCVGPDQQGRMSLLMEICHSPISSIMMNEQHQPEFPLEEKIIAYVIASTLKALKYLHNLGIIHRG